LCGVFTTTSNTSDKTTLRENSRTNFDTLNNKKARRQAKNFRFGREERDEDYSTPPHRDGHGR